MKKTVTLTLDEDLLRAARKVAVDRDTSVSQLVRDHLARLVEEADRQRALERIREIFKTTKAKAGAITWTRDELYNR